MNNRTAFVVYAAPSERAGCVELAAPQGGRLQVWPLKAANNLQRVVEAA